MEKFQFYIPGGKKKLFQFRLMLLWICKERHAAGCQGSKVNLECGALTFESSAHPSYVRVSKSVWLAGLTWKRREVRGRSLVGTVRGEPRLLLESLVDVRIGNAGPFLPGPSCFVMLIPASTKSHDNVRFAFLKNVLPAKTSLILPD